MPAFKGERRGLWIIEIQSLVPLPHFFIDEDTETLSLLIFIGQFEKLGRKNTSTVFKAEIQLVGVEV